MQNRVAIIDLGTNTFHLLIAVRSGNDHRVIHQERSAVKIGKGGINEGYITEGAIERALAALGEFKITIEKLQVDKVLVFGTSAIRNARNGKEVADLIHEFTGFDVRIISGEEEATYIYEGVRLAGVLAEEKSLIVDIGGGSVEFIIGNQHEIFWKHSFEIGAQRLLERFQKHDPILPEEVEKVNSYLTEELKPLLEQTLIYHPEILVGSSGTFDTLSEIHCIRHNIPYQPESPETPLTFESFEEIYPVLLSKNRAERLLIPGMIEMRVDMIVVACCLIRFLTDHSEFKQVRVSTYSLKEGVLAGIG